MRLEFWVEGKPECKRPRRSSGGNGHMMFVPAEVSAWRRVIAATAREAAGGNLVPFAGLLALTIDAYGAPADLDNIAKTVLDALNGVAFVDDGQIARLLVTAPDRQLAKGGRPKRAGFERQGVRVVIEAVAS